MPKDASSRTTSRRHNPLHEELVAHNSVRPKPSRPTKHRDNDPDMPNGEYVDAGLSRKILRMAREQQDELEGEDAPGGASRRTSNGVISPGGSSTGSGGFSAIRFNAEDEDDESEEEYDAEEFGEDEYEDVEEVVCSPPLSQPSGFITA